MGNWCVAYNGGMVEKKHCGCMQIKWYDMLSKMDEVTEENDHW